ncbi:hypothetical protein OH76DRAFT_209138 [Lentinus brumalis]|uniref:Uncharacterized protein n=1 Tax=Lentinus brumalis TaxID=2498619 RepID=A0A371DIJ5_9APHY|nr:hypothetical protein OH76DRAFT_209138 [Polyporus brumalis]
MYMGCGVFAEPYRMYNRPGAISQQNSLLSRATGKQPKSDPGSSRWRSRLHPTAALARTYKRRLVRDRCSRVGLESRRASRLLYRDFAMTCRSGRLERARLARPNTLSQSSSSSTRAAPTP